jgi:hypothetical protein
MTMLDRVTNEGPGSIYIAAHIRDVIKCPLGTNCTGLHTALYLAEVEHVVDDVEEHFG